MSEQTDEISVLINKVYAELFKLRDERDRWQRALESAVVKAGDAMLKELTELRETLKLMKEAK